MSLSVVQVAQARHMAEDTMGDTVGVQTFTGEGAYGAVYAASVSVTCNLDATRRLVLSAEGEEVVSEFTLQVAAADAAKFTPESLVTYATRVSRVLSANPKTFHGETVYVEVACR